MQRRKHERIYEAMRWSLINHLVQSAEKVKQTPNREMPGYLMVDDPIFKALRKRNASLNQAFDTHERVSALNTFEYQGLDGITEEVAVQLFPIISMQLMVTCGFTLGQALLLLPELRIAKTSLPARVDVDVRPYVLAMAKQARGESAVVPDLSIHYQFSKKHKGPNGWWGIPGWLSDFVAVCQQGGQYFRDLSIQQAKEYFPLACVQLMIEEGIPFDDAMAMIPELRLV